MKPVNKQDPKRSDLAQRAIVGMLAGAVSGTVRFVLTWLIDG
jgi:hypothetical protein